MRREPPLPPSLKVAFAGTPEFAVPALQALARHGYDIPLVLTQPDRRAGRGRRFHACAVKRCAESLRLPLAQVDDLRSEANRRPLREAAPDLMIVVAYGLILPPAVLSIPRYGCINIHASLLPRWRGAAPIQRAILAGDTVTGVTLMQMDAGLDAGPIIAQRSCAIAAQDTAGSLHDRLSALGAELVIETLPPYLRGEIQAVPQAEAGACYAPKLDKREALIDWRQPAVRIERQIRAFNPWPIAQTQLEGEPLRLWEARLQHAEGTHGRPGEVLDIGDEGVSVAAGEGTLTLLTVQRPGKRPVSARDLNNSLALKGRRLG